MPSSCPATVVGGGRKKTRRRRGPYVWSGVHTIKRELAALEESEVGAALREWRADLVRDLGGADVVSTQQLALVDLACRTKLLVESVDAFILTMPSPVNRQKRRLFDVVKERSALARDLQGVMRDLGLDRRTKDADDAAILAALRRTS